MGNTVSGIKSAFHRELASMARISLLAIVILFTGCLKPVAVDESYVDGDPISPEEIIKRKNAGNAIAPIPGDLVAPSAPSFVAFNPSSPSKTPLNAVRIIGLAPSADTNRINIYTTQCTGSPIAFGSKQVFETSGISLNLAANSSAILYGQAVDTSNNMSGCMQLNSAAYVHDNMAPSVPSLASLAPTSSSASPSTSSMVTARLNNLSGDTVKVNFYSNPSCSNLIASSTNFSNGVSLSVSTAGGASTTNIFANAEDSLGNVSACSNNSLTFYYQAAANVPLVPASPVISAFSPAASRNTPYNNRRPTVRGSAPNNMSASQTTVTGTVSLYRDDQCQNLVAQGSKANFEGSGLALTSDIASGSIEQELSLYVRAQDAANSNNISNCTLAGSVTYYLDTLAPNAPSLSSNPVSPSTLQNLNLLGSASNSADVQDVAIYSGSCGGTLISQVTKAVFESSGVAAVAAANATTTFYARSIDRAGNPSSCSTLAYQHRLETQADRRTAALNILATNCASCHNTLAPTFGSYTTDQQFADARLVSISNSTGVASNSLIFRTLKGVSSLDSSIPVPSASKAMPPSSQLSTSQLTVIRNWINGITANAPAATPSPAPTMPASSTLTAMITNIRTKCSDQSGTITPLHQLNNDEIHYSINDALGTTSDLRAKFPSDNIDTEGFKNNALFLKLDTTKLNALIDTTETKVTEALAAKTAAVSCGTSTTLTDSCVRTILSSLLRKAFRRTVTTAEIDSRMAFYSTQKVTYGATEALKETIKAIFVDPEFIYLNTSRDSQASLAATLAALIWRSIPDEALLQAAAAGQLSTSAQLETQIERMIADSRSNRFFTTFTGEWLGTVALLGSSKIDRSKFDPKLLDAMYAESNEYLKYIVAENQLLSELMEGDFTFVNQTLASHYGVTGITGDALRRVTKVKRLGLLSNASHLLLKSGANESSPTGRGNFILSNITCSPPPPFPDGGAITPLANPNPNSTIRENLAIHRKSPACAACHVQMDEVGLSMESFDRLGKIRSFYESNMRAIDTSGELYGIRFQNTQELIRLLAARNNFKQCLSKKLITYSTSRNVSPRDACYADELGKNISAVDNRGMTLLKAILVLSLLK